MNKRHIISNILRGEKYAFSIQHVYTKGCIWTEGVEYLFGNIYTKIVWTQKAKGVDEKISIVTLILIVVIISL